MFPRHRVPPIANPIHPSLNQWSHLDNIAMGALKVKWGAFIRWLVVTSNYQNLKIEKCKVTITYYYPTRHRHDNDNQTPKFIMDSLVECGMLIDDDYKHVNPLIIYGDYSKDNPRTEILIEVDEG